MSAEGRKEDEKGRQVVRAHVCYVFHIHIHLECDRMTQQVKHINKSNKQIYIIQDPKLNLCDESMFFSTGFDQMLIIISMWSGDPSLVRMQSFLYVSIALTHTSPPQPTAL